VQEDFQIWFKSLRAGKLSHYSVWLWAGQLEDQGSIPGKGERNFPLASLQLWGPPSLLYNGIEGPFPEAKAWPGHDADHAPSSSANVENE
jgi:hypothetical protein